MQRRVIYFFHIQINFTMNTNTMSANKGAQLVIWEFKQIFGRPNFRKLYRCCLSETQLYRSYINLVPPYKSTFKESSLISAN